MSNFLTVLWDTLQLFVHVLSTKHGLTLPGCDPSPVTLYPPPTLAAFLDANTCKVSRHGAQGCCHMSPVRYCSLPLCKLNICTSRDVKIHWKITVKAATREGAAEDCVRWLISISSSVLQSLSLVCEPETSRIVVWGKKFILLFLESFCFTLSL